jgi:hypothetical protein
MFSPPSVGLFSVASLYFHRKLQEFCRVIKAAFLSVVTVTHWLLTFTVSIDCEVVWLGTWPSHPIIPTTSFTRPAYCRFYRNVRSDMLEYMAVKDDSSHRNELISMWFTPWHSVWESSAEDMVIWQAIAVWPPVGKAGINWVPISVSSWREFVTAPDHLLTNCIGIRTRFSKFWGYVVVCVQLYCRWSYV